MNDFHHIQEECCEANRRLSTSGLVDLTFGNVSVLDRTHGIFAIKPSGVEYSALVPSQMVLVDLAGHQIGGDLRPSVDTPTHARLFQAFPAIGAIVHTHSRNAAAFAQAGRPVPCLGTTHADYFNGEIPVTRELADHEISHDYEWETGNAIVERFANLDPMEMRAVLVRGHGPFAWGVSASEAVENALALEIVSDLAAKTLRLNPGAGGLQAALIAKHFHRKHGNGSYYGQELSLSALST